MLWPDADGAGERAEWMRTCRAGFIRQAIADMPAALRTVENTEFLAWHSQALDSMPPRILSDRANRPYRHGFLAGELLAGAVYEYVKTGGKVKLESLKSAMTAEGRRKAHNPWISVSRH
jgi:hypothetical protein